MITLIDFNEIPGKPEYMLFKSENEGYIFSKKGNLYSEASIMIYKTINGGKDWQQIYFANDWLFYGYAKLYDNAIFGNIKSSKNVAKNNLFKLNLATQEFKLFDFNIEAIGNVWVKNDSVCLSFYNKPQNYILTTDTSFSAYSVKFFGYTPKTDGVVSDNINTYFVTWKNQLVVETDGEYKEVAITEPACITKIAENKVLIATNEHKNAINLYQYDLARDKLEKLTTFENYSFINYLQSNENVIVGFVGTETYFPVYDLIYSTDKGQTWQILKLKELMITPNCLINNVLYIYSGINLQKITF